MAPDKVDDAVVRAAKAVARENRVGLGGEVAISEEQQFDTVPDRILAGGKPAGPQFYVRHIDLSRNLAYRLGVLRL